MNAEQKKRAMQMLRRFSQANPRTLHADNAAVDMAALLQELIDAPEAEPVAKTTGYYGGHLTISTVDGRVLTAGTALYLAPPAPSVPDGWQSGVTSVIKLIEKRRDDYHREYGRQEPDTGVWNYPGTGEDWMNDQDELLDEIRAMLEAAPQPPRLSDERILEICGFRPESASEIGSDIVRKRWLEIGRAIEREILGNKK